MKAPRNFAPSPAVARRQERERFEGAMKVRTPPAKTFMGLPVFSYPSGMGVSFAMVSDDGKRVLAVRGERFEMWERDGAEGWRCIA
jgi:hypothetical protein